MVKNLSEWVKRGKSERNGKEPSGVGGRGV